MKCAKWKDDCYYYNDGVTQIRITLCVCEKMSQNSCWTLLGNDQGRLYRPQPRDRVTHHSVISH